MCRWLAYSGNPIPLETLLFGVEHNLIDQSLSSHSRTSTNGDGFGVGWYDTRTTPGLFRSIRPAWNDANLRDLAAHIDSPLFLAHLRAASRGAVQETNCHPFRYGRWLFVHNGEIGHFEALHRDLLFAVDPGSFRAILGSTDSELMFHLALSLGLERDPLGALARMAGLVERCGRAHGLEPALCMTLGLSDGESIWAVRYASDGNAPTLYHSRDVEDLLELNPQLATVLGAHACAVVSEPVGRFAEVWSEIAQGWALHAHAGRIESFPFGPSG